MDTLINYKDIYKDDGLVVALGNFDGVHLGHKKLFDKLVAEGNRLKLKTMVYTFEKHPRQVLTPDKPFHQLMDNYQKINYIEALGLDYLYLEDFLLVKDLPAEEFIEKILKDMFNVKAVVIGWNYRFGKKGEGTPELLMQMGLRLGFDVNVVPAVEYHGHVVSSTIIRHLIRTGELEKAREYLGHPYSIRSRVIHGKRNGGKIGIHTANQEISSVVTLPQKGVYATYTYYMNKKYISITNVGNNPTFEGEKITAETHIFDFHGDLYGEIIEVELVKRIRDEKKFDTVDKLLAQISQDISVRMAIHTENNTIGDL